MKKNLFYKRIAVTLMPITKGHGKRSRQIMLAYGATIFLLLFFLAPACQKKSEFDEKEISKSIHTPINDFWTYSRTIIVSTSLKADTGTQMLPIVIAALRSMKTTADFETNIRKLGMPLWDRSLEFYDADANKTLLIPVGNNTEKGVRAIIAVKNSGNYEHFKVNVIRRGQYLEVRKNDLNLKLLTNDQWEAIFSAFDKKSYGTGKSQGFLTAEKHGTKVMTGSWQESCQTLNSWVIINSSAGTTFTPVQSCSLIYVWDNVNYNLDNYNYFEMNFVQSYTPCPLMNMYDFCASEIVNNTSSSSCAWRLFERLKSRGAIGAINQIVNQLDSISHVRVTVIDGPSSQSMPLTSNYRIWTYFTSINASSTARELRTTVSINAQLLNEYSKEYAAASFMHSVIQDYFSTPERYPKLAAHNSTQLEQFYVIPFANYLMGQYGISQYDAIGLAWGGMTYLPAYESTSLHSGMTNSEIDYVNHLYRSTTLGFRLCEPD